MSQPAINAPADVTFRISIPCELSEVPAARVALKRFLKGQSLADPDLSACELAMTEACNNAIQNATPEGRKRPIEVLAACTPSTIELEVIDHTAGFDWPQKAELPEFVNEHGRGLFFIQSFMDRAEYSRGADQNRLVMRRTRVSQRNPQARAPDDTSVIIQLPNRRSFWDEAAVLRAKLDEMEQALTEMARELCFRSETLAAMCRCSAELGRSNDLKDFAERLLNDLLHIAAAEWFVLRLVSEQKTELLPFVTSLPDLALKAIKFDPQSKSASVEVRCALTGEDIDFDPDSPFDANDRPQFAGSSGLIHPIRLDQQLIGTLAIGRSSVEPPFSMAQREVIRTFGDFLAIQLISARLREQQLSARLVAHELEIARGIQRSLLPRDFPRLPGFSIAAECESARQVGGDFYDLLQISDSSALFVIADVMGKGVPAALFAALLRSLIRTHQSRTVRPAEVLTRINQFLFDDLSAVDMFITAQIVLLDCQERRLVVANAGHNPMLLASAGSERIQPIASEGMPLGVARDAVFDEQVISLPPQSRLLLFTDGITEARNSAGECFGQEKLESCFAQCAQQTAAQSKQTLLATLQQFEAGSSLRDDRTFLIVAEESRLINAPVQAGDLPASTDSNPLLDCPILVENREVSRK